MKRNLLMAGIAGTVVSLSALADGTVTQSATISSAQTTWTQTVNIPKFDSSLGTLASISYTISGTLTGTAQASNNSTTSTDSITLNLTAILKLTDFNNVTLAQTTPLTQSTATLAALPNGTPTPDYLPPSGITLNNLSVNYTKTQSTSDAAELALFTGTGTIPLTMKATGQSFGQGDSGNDTFNFTTFADASVQVVYNYTTAVPEASTWAAIGFVGLAGGATYLRRRQAKANA